jgi:alpha-glucosidase
MNNSSSRLFRLNNPHANPKACIVIDDVRITVLTSRLLRMEWSENGKFEDHASLVVLNRRLPVPSFSIRTAKNRFILETDHLKLSYKLHSGKFDATNLEVSFMMNGKRVRWTPGTIGTQNLLGTTRTLDGKRGACELEPGLLSRSGWAILDDTRRPVFNDENPPWVMPRGDYDHQDYYFFGYGHDYKQALYDYTLVAGNQPMPPRFVFGLWWSRYWAYTDQELKQLIYEFDIHSVPLDVLVIDMDWHITHGLRWRKKELDQAGQRLGWSGYTWDKDFFPNPASFLKWCKRKGIRTALNLHPASGIQPHEERYEAMADAMGIDPGKEQFVPFDIVDKKFAKKYLNVILHPLENEGVDFWWLDWQQWHTTSVPGLSPTWWLNHLFFIDKDRRGNERPLIFHRWGGLGNHRYPIGFSGDAISVWESLAFQPNFTATASNVCFGYWSHDIGGHMPGPVSPELFTRWMQFGAFSPILRTHTSKLPHAERRIWAYPNKHFHAMRDTILLRYALIPYIYSAAREAYDTGVSICRPLYYDHPEREEAYTFKDQYMFGNDILVSPVVIPVDPISQLTRKKIWLPEGEWVEWFSGKRLRGGKVYERAFAFDEIPLYVKAGSMLPMQPSHRNAAADDGSTLILSVVRGEQGHTSLYEDDGISKDYQRGHFATTPLSFNNDGDKKLIISIDARKGTFKGAKKRRRYEIRLIGFVPPTEVRCNTRKLHYSDEEDSIGWRYNGDSMTTIITGPDFKTNQRVTFSIKLPEVSKSVMKACDGFPGILRRLRSAMELINLTWPQEWSPNLLVGAVQTGNRISLDPISFEKEIVNFYRQLPDVLSSIEKLEIEPHILQRVQAHLADVIKRNK